MNELELKLTLPEINQILEALGAMPYRHVYQLIAKIQQQAETQLQPEVRPNGSVSSATAIEQRSER